MDLHFLCFGVRYVADRLLLLHSPARIQNLGDFDSALTSEEQKQLSSKTRAQGVLKLLSRTEGASLSYTATDGHQTLH